MALSDRQKRFVDEYLIDCNATQAAIRAGYTAQFANKTGPRLLVNVGIAREIERRRNRIANKYELTAEKVIKELARIGFGSPRQVAEWGPHGLELKDSKTLSDDDAALIESVTYRESSGETSSSRSISFKTHNKIQALTKLGDHLGLFNEKTPLELILALLPDEARDAARRAIAGEVQPE